jgi:hypothetical protein
LNSAQPLETASNGEEEPEPIWLIKLVGEGPKAKVQVNEVALDKLRWIDNALVGDSTVDNSLKQSGISVCTLMGKHKVGKSELLNTVLGRS